MTLSGNVSNILAKDRAERIASAVKGVKTVVNRIDVEPTIDRTPLEIENDIERSLSQDSATTEMNVKINVTDNGVVSLNGSVDSWQEKQLAGKIAKSIKGVTQLNNNIEIDYEFERTDEEIKNEIQQALQWSVLVDDALINAEVQEGNVTLSGIVGSYAEKQKAISKAWVTGVNTVNASQLEVERWARDEELRQDKYIDKSNQEIQNAVQEALLYDPRVNSFDIDVDVSTNVVTLRGQVDSLKAKRAARKDAQNTVGVIEVKNRLRVRLDQDYSDESVEERLTDALEQNPYVERFEILVEVNNGVARLSGTVDSYFEKGKADDIASKTMGVTAVENNIDVENINEPYDYSPYISDFDAYEYDWYDYQPRYTFKNDSEIKEDVKDEMWWSPYVDSDEVNVQVDDGIATLTGTVDSWSEYRAAQNNAYDGGATWVDNDLNVEQQQNEQSNE